MEHWVAPDACTLPTVEQPLRVAEFDGLFTQADGIRRPDPTRMALSFPGRAGLRELAEDLARRESGCCSFFAFAVTEDDDGRLEMTIAVPEARTDVLAALTERAARRIGTAV